MSPRLPDELPPAVLATLRRAAARHDREDARFKQAVVDALAHGSVRQVAAAVGISPTTVQTWSKEQAG